ncbi:MAG TPA: PBP1A family penicillin-binding protein [Caulobacteraceae bacterium]|jgi:penicillin-binding protein 1A|nr:PBP1A family penicillin-binding protein [Caulobacteraceae bacterium]
MANPADGGSPPPPRRRRSFLGGTIYWGLVLGVWALIFLAGFLAVFARDLPDTSKLYEVHRQPSITYLDRSGSVIAVRGSQYSPPANIDALPAYVPAAFVAVEDRQFYHHFGFNPWGMFRSEIYNLGHPHGTLRGGSTITQQLARNLFLTPAQTYRRKVQELILAVWLEMHFSKKQILALYLNRVNFGGGAYGIEAAAQRYFNKPASNLTLGEAALLAATMKGPTRYNPAANSDRAARRATMVLDEMVETGAITPEERDAAFREPVRVSATLADQRGQYFVDMLDAQVRSLVGEPTEDLVVETTLDLPIQAAAEQAVRAGVAAHAGEGVAQGALISVDGQGRIRAYVGGTDYSKSQFDRVSQARRQAGSAWKPFVYLTAMEAGHTPSEQIVDAPITIGKWTPRNYTGRYLGRISLETALAQSINTVAARLANELGTAQVAQTAHRLGIVSPIQLQPSMALGAVDVSPLEMAEAYDVFANGGFKVDAYGVERIRTAAGKVLYQHDMAASQKIAVVSAPALPEMDEMLRQVMVSGTGARARIGGYDLAGKTGTTSDYKDAWFIGFTGGFTTAVWVGRDDATPMRRVTGGGAPAQIWRAYMAQALPRLQVQPIPGGTPLPPEAPDAIDQALSGLGAGPDMEAPPELDQPPELTPPPPVADQGPQPD